MFFQNRSCNDFSKIYDKIQREVKFFMYKGTHRITYYDLDMAGRVKLSALLKMVHIAADVNANDLGIGFKELSRAGMSFILQRFAISAERMPAYDETVTIRTWPSSVARGTFTRKGDMYDANGKKIMEWASLWILFDITARKILKPNALPVQLPSFEEHDVQIAPEKIILPDDLHSCEIFSQYEHTVRYCEVDTNMHMNNSIYGDVISNALLSQTWREVQINYLAETRLNEKINVTAFKNDEKIYVTGNANGKNSFTALVK
jgi:medium-chain acyl-[acyl-carrier-protein] hydrolase